MNVQQYVYLQQGCKLGLAISLILFLQILSVRCQHYFCRFIFWAIDLVYKRLCSHWTILNNIRKLATHACIHVTELAYTVFSNLSHTCGIWRGERMGGWKSGLFRHFCVISSRNYYGILVKIIFFPMLQFCSRLQEISVLSTVCPSVHQLVNYYQIQSKVRSYAIHTLIDVSVPCHLNKQEWLV